MEIKEYEWLLEDRMKINKQDTSEYQRTVIILHEIMNIYVYIYEQYNVQ